MIRPEQLWLVEVVDMRGGIDSLSPRIQNLLGRSLCDGAAYAFRNRRGTRLKLLIWDGSGVWLCHRRLHRGHFVWPTAAASTVSLSLEFDTSEAKNGVTPRSGAGFRAIFLKTPRYMDCP